MERWGHLVYTPFEEKDSQTCLRRKRNDEKMKVIPFLLLKNTELESDIVFI